MPDGRTGPEGRGEAQAVFSRISCLGETVSAAPEGRRRSHRGRRRDPRVTREGRDAVGSGPPRESASPASARSGGGHPGSGVFGQDGRSPAPGRRSCLARDMGRAEGATSWRDGVPAWKLIGSSATQAAGRLKPCARGVRIRKSGGPRRQPRPSADQVPASRSPSGRQGAAHPAPRRSPARSQPCQRRRWRPPGQSHAWTASDRWPVS